MDITQLRGKLARRFRSKCSGANADPSDSSLEDALDTARRELGKKFPKPELYDFSADSNGVVELVEDIDGVTEPIQVISVTGVYIQDRGWAGYPHKSSPSEIFGAPSLGIMDSKIRDSFNRSVDFIRHGHKLRIVERLEAPNRGIKGIALINRPLEWADIPEWQEELIIKRALIAILEDGVINKDGLVRLPSPMGYFEFDGGHNFRQMRDNLRAEWEAETTPGTYGLMHG